VPLPAGRTGKRVHGDQFAGGRYPSLAAGHYTSSKLRFCATGAKPVGGVFVRRAGAVVQTWWAQAIDVFVSALLLLGSLVAAAAKPARRERLERAVAERSAELAKANKELEEASLSDR